jgi:hypothetical protein
MAVSHQGVFVQTPEIANVQVTHGNSTNVVTLFTSATSGQGTKIVGVTALNIMTSNRIAHLTVAGNNVTTQTVAASAGNDGVTANTNMLGQWTGLPKDNDGQVYFFLKAGNVLGASLTVAATTNKPVWFAVLGADF